MTFPKTTAFALTLVFAALSLYSQQQTPAAETGAEMSADGERSAPDLSRLSVFDLLEAAAGTSLDWRPGWPLSLPPGLFRVFPESSVTSIALTFEPPFQPSAAASSSQAIPASTSAAVPVSQTARSANAVPTAAPEETAALPPQLTPITVRRQNGVLAEFPVFLEGSADAPNPLFFQGRAEYAGNGALRRITVGGGPDLEATVLDYDEENRPLLIRLLIAGEYFFSALEYSPARLTETRYDQDGVPAAVMYVDDLGEDVRITYNRAGSNAGNALPAGEDDLAKSPAATEEIRRIFRNAAGTVSGLELPAETWSALYERRGLPRYLDRTLNAAFNDDSAVSVAAGVGNAPERYSFQWDENGRLIRLIGADAGGQAVSDSRYEYTLDSRGNWTERREITMRNAAGRLFPAPGLTVRRRIVYGGQP
ncbi:hypothetical protein FACS1894161_1670 [Spirochaetia bacterium]|nr:hypothetical protein FACS1894161_1670 [Spirochaetia bacterium]